MTSKVQGKFHSLAESLRGEVQGEVYERVSMRPYTSFRIGGLCELMAFPKTEAELERILSRSQAQGYPWRVIGAGTNLLVRDGGVEEVLVNLSRTFQQIQLSKDGEIVAEAGLRLARLVKTCQVQGFSGLEFAAGIPGTVGGAAAMNAGAMGSDMAAVVERIRGFAAGSGTFQWQGKQLKWSYRSLERPPEAVFTNVMFQLIADDPKQIRARIVQGLRERRFRQPLHYPSAGSVFKNPPGRFAGQLIEETGLKGQRIGDAQISDKHGNFIVNRGRARSRDVLALIERVRQAVAERTGIELQLEIEVIGKD